MVLTGTSGSDLSQQNRLNLASHGSIDTKLKYHRSYHSTAHSTAQHAAQSLFFKRKVRLLMFRDSRRGGIQIFFHPGSICIRSSSYVAWPNALHWFIRAAPAGLRVVKRIIALRSFKNAIIFRMPLPPLPSPKVHLQHA